MSEIEKVESIGAGMEVLNQDFDLICTKLESIAIERKSEDSYLAEKIDLLQDTVNAVSAQVTIAVRTLNKLQSQERKAASITSSDHKEQMRIHEDMREIPPYMQREVKHEEMG